MNFSLNTFERTAVADARYRPDARAMLGQGRQDANLRRDARALTRLATSMAAMVRADRGETPGCIRNVSPRGVMLSMATPPARGEFVEIVVRNRSLIGQVKWSDDFHAGVALRDSIDVQSLLSGERHSVASRLEPARKTAAVPSSATLYPSSHIIARQLQFASMIAFGVFCALMIAFAVNDLLAEVVNQVNTGLAG